MLSGAGPHPKALSGRLISCSWWLFTIVLLACYFSNLSSSKASDSTHLTVKGFEDLANQDMVEYGCLSGSSTLAFFKVETLDHLWIPRLTAVSLILFFLHPEFKQPSLPQNLWTHGENKEFCVIYGRRGPTCKRGKLCLYWRVCFFGLSSSTPLWTGQGTWSCWHEGIQHCCCPWWGYSFWKSLNNDMNYIINIKPINFLKARPSLRTSAWQSYKWVRQGSWPTCEASGGPAAA